MQGWVQWWVRWWLCLVRVFRIAIFNVVNFVCIHKTKQLLLVEIRQRLNVIRVVQYVQILVGLVLGGNLEKFWSRTNFLNAL